MSVQVVADEPARQDGIPPSAETIDFERHVAPLFRRLGCNAGACHGSFDGQGGFRLSLFGQSPAKDYAAITGDAASRRVVSDAPDESLLLAKPSRHVDHEGGLRMPDDSWQYAIVRRWVQQGARRTPASGEVRKLVVQVPPRNAADVPPSIGNGVPSGPRGVPPSEGNALSGRAGVPQNQRGRQTAARGTPQRAFPTDALKLIPGESLRLEAIAEFADGTTEDVTAFVELRSRDEAVATVGDDGGVMAIESGSTSIVASYLRSFADALVIVPFPPTEQSPARLPPANLIDEEIDRRLGELALTSSPPASDAEFLRRATLDVLGTVPTVDAVRDFNPIQAL